MNLKNKNLYKTILIISIFVFIFASLFLFINKKTEAASPTIEEIELKEESQAPAGSPNALNWNWLLGVKTTNVTSGTNIIIDIYKLTEKIHTETIQINNNYLEYHTHYRLENLKTHSVYFTLDIPGPMVRKIYIKRTGTTVQNTQPEIISFTPTEAKIGSFVTIGGNNLAGATDVLFGETKAIDVEIRTVNIVNTNTRIFVKVPPGATDGKITVKTPQGDAISSGVFKIKTDPVVPVTPRKTTGLGAVSDTYKLLAPISKDLTEIKTDDIGAYFNLIFKIAIGLCGVLAVLMIVVFGIQYMGSESVFGKTEAKQRILGAILGLLIALGSYALLNTIDPALLGGGGLKVRGLSVEVISKPDAGDDVVDLDFAKKIYKYETNTPVSVGVANALVKLKGGEWKLEGFRVFPSNNRMAISLIKGNSRDVTNLISISPGSSGNGYSEIGVDEEKKTPKGSWKILEIRTSPNNTPVFNGKGSNMGATFWLLNPRSSGERGIGMHGNKDGTLGTTNGCLRLTNADLLALLPYVKKGMEVVIKD